VANTNTLTYVTPKLLAQGLLALRENAITPQLVNRQYEAMAGQKGSQIQIPVPSAIAAGAVAPSYVAPDDSGVSPTEVSIQLDQWYEAPFFLSDKDMLTAMDGTIPMQASEAVKALGNQVDNNLLANYKGFYGYEGTLNAGGTAHLDPFVDDNGDPTNPAAATAIRKVLNTQLAPLNDRHIIMNPECEAAALNLRAFQDGSYSGDFRAIRDGNLNDKLGFRWWMNQNVPDHTRGSENGSTIVNDGGDALAIGDKTVAVDGGTGTILKGDLITFAGDATVYVATATSVDSSGGNLLIEPGLVADPGDGAAVTVKKGGAQNLAIQRGAIGFATRPLEAHGSALGVISRSIVDRVSGLTLRLEITHQHKRVRFAYDILWGSGIVRREFGARLYGA
jgi:hypothetical protein